MSGKGKGKGLFSCEAQGKVSICHKPDTKAMKTLCVASKAVKGHLKHSDRLGACMVPAPASSGGGRRTLSTLPGAQAAIDHSPFAILAILGGVVLWAYKTAKARNDKAVTEEQEVNEGAELV